MILKLRNFKDQKSPYDMQTFHLMTIEKAQTQKCIFFSLIQVNTSQTLKQRRFDVGYSIKTQKKIDLDF